MFPVIFTLTLERSTASSEATSGLLCTAIVGGAFVPLLVGALADQAGYVTALVVAGRVLRRAVPVRARRRAARRCWRTPKGRPCTDGQLDRPVL